MMELVTMGPVESGPDELERQVRAVLSTQKEKPVAAILYCPIDAIRPGLSKWDRAWSMVEEMSYAVHCLSMQ